MSTNRDILISLLGEVDRALKSFRRMQEQHAATVAPRFNVFTYVRPGETRHSRILADLLDPRGAHGQQDTFLGLFLRAVELHTLGGTSSARVSCEHMTDPGRSSRRIDILIRGKGWLVAIENKPKAADGELQVSSYLEWLGSQSPSAYHLIYLSTDKRKPSTHSISEAECTAALASRHLVLMSYSDIAEWLDACRKASRAERVTWFLDSYRDFVREQLLGFLPAEAQEMVVDTVLDPNNAQYLHAALELIQSRDAIRQRLRTLLMQQLQSQLPSGWHVHRNLPEHGAIGLRLDTVPGWHFGVESNSQGWWYGIKCDDGSKLSQRTALVRKGERLLKELRWNTPAVEWWPLWRWFEGHGDHDPPEYRNWDTSTKVWLDMHSGAMARNLIALAEELQTLFA